MSAHQTSAVRGQAPGEKPLDWRQRGACRDVDPDLFHVGTDTKAAEPGQPSDPPQPWEQDAIRICRRRPIQARCRDEALRWPESEQYGVSGGMTAGQRIELLRASGQQPQVQGTDVVNLSDLPLWVDLRAVQALLDGMHTPAAGPAERRWTAVALHRGGWRNEQIARRLGVAECTVRYFLAQARKDAAKVAETTGVAA